MEFLSFLYLPFGFIFRIFYDLVSNYGLALFLFTLLFRLILLPSSISQQKGTAKQMRLQPKIKKLQEKYKGNQVKLNEEMQALYSREGYNPMSAGCLPMLIQLPVIFGLLGVIYYPIQYVLGVDSNTVGEMTKIVQGLLGDTSIKQNLLELQVFNHLDEVIAKLPNLSAEIIDKLRGFDYTMFGIPLAETPSVATLSHIGSASKQELILLLVPLFFWPVGYGVRYLYLDPPEADQSRNGEKPDDGLHGLWHAAVFPCDRVPISPLGRVFIGLCPISLHLRR
ncbi:MAG: YidC/Oxa1 family membrane protein insertase [Acutalibacteraceae bacterium]